VALLIAIDRIIALVKVRITHAHGRAIEKRARNSRRSSGSALCNGGLIIHIGGADKRIVTVLNHIMSPSSTWAFTKTTQPSG
jgi:hypothetical protein